MVPTVGYADEDVFLPQWAIAGIVIGLASLLFVIIFGVTVVSKKNFDFKRSALIELNLPMLKPDTASIHIFCNVTLCHWVSGQTV
jgi:hypothetical protein